MKVNHDLVRFFDVANMSFNAICENKILAKISEFTVIPSRYVSIGIQAYWITSKISCAGPINAIVHLSD